MLAPLPNPNVASSFESFQCKFTQFARQNSTITRVSIVLKFRITKYAECVVRFISILAHLVIHSG